MVGLRIGKWGHFLKALGDYSSQEATWLQPTKSTSFLYPASFGTGVSLLAHFAKILNVHFGAPRVARAKEEILHRASSSSVDLKGF